MTDNELKPVHPALSRNDTLYTEKLAAAVFEDPDRFMEAWRIAMSGDDNEEAAVLLNHLRLRPDYFGPTRKAPRRIGLSAMRFQSDLAKASATLRETVIATRRQIDRFTLKAMSRQQGSPSGQDANLIGQAIASALAELLGNLIAEISVLPAAEKVIAAVDQAAGIADDSASRSTAPDAAALSQMASDMRTTARDAAQDEHFKNITFRLNDLKREQAERTADNGDTAVPEGDREAHENEAIEIDDDAPISWKAGGKVSNRQHDDGRSEHVG